MTCVICGGPVVVLGTLGNRTHGRCRNCGADCSKTIHRRSWHKKADAAIKKYAETDAKAAFDLETFRHQRNANMGDAVRDHLKGGVS